jgi:hypothetical protein
MSVLRHQSWLVERGYITIEVRPNTSHLYTIKNPDSKKKWVRGGVPQIDTTSQIIAPLPQIVAPPRHNLLHRVVPLEEITNEGLPPLRGAERFISGWVTYYRVANDGRRWMGGSLSSRTQSKIKEWFRQNPEIDADDLLKIAADMWLYEVAGNETKFYWTRECREAPLKFLERVHEIRGELGHTSKNFDWPAEVRQVVVLADRLMG